ncbi:MAG: MATE family efflux transporter [Eubacteriales bacterium]|nr:MATE family efflux transporter [Eubacteriales bacterium]
MLKMQTDSNSSAVIDRMFTTAMVAFIFSNLATAIGPTVDGIVVGSHYSVDEVAAIGLTAFILVGYRTISASIITRGAHVISSQRIGKGDKEGANRVFTLSVILSVTAAVVLALLSIVFSNQIAAFLGARGGMSYLLKPTSDYLRGYCIGLPFFAAMSILTPFLQMDGDYNRVTLSSVVMTIIDILADLFVVRVLHGGLFQIGVATAAGYMAAFLVTASHFVFKKSIFRFVPKEIRLSESREILLTGLPTGVVKLSNTFCGILINNMLAATCTGEIIAALSVGNQLSKFCFSLWLGAASTLLSFTSMFFGEEDRQALKDVQKIAIRKGLLLTCSAAVGILIFAGPLGYVFLRNTDGATRKLAEESIRFFALSMPMNVFIYCFQQYLIGAGRRLYANLYSFILDFAIPVPMTMVFLAVLGGRGAWVAKPFINIAVVLAAVLYIMCQRGRSFTEKMLLLPENFGTGPEHEFCMEGDSMFDINGVSRIAIAFILENGFGKHDAEIVSLAIEELAGNIVQHGFTDNKPHHVDIRILAKDDALIVRLRDDCRPFDPVDKYRKELQYDTNPENGIAIKMMMRLIREIKYTGLYGMNNLILRI